jgi:hypothetical protein
MRTFPNAVSAYKAGELSDADLYRTIMAWPQWLVARDPEDPGDAGVRLAILRDPQGFGAMEIFSDQAALDAFVEREDTHLPGRVAEVPGYRIFGHPQVAALHRVNLDMHSPHATHFYEQQLPMLGAWARITEVELALTVPDRFGDPVDVIRRFDEYRVLVQRDGGSRGLVMAPDSRGRSLAAIFTADDLIDAFVAEVEGDLEGALEIEHKTGVELFGELAPLGLDGVVFNPLTHLPPVALRGEILRVLATPPGPHLH